MAINRENYVLLTKYLDYRRDVSRLSDLSLRLEKTWLTHYLLWADKKSFKQAQNIRPSFLTYLDTARLDSDDPRQFSHEYIRKMLSSGRRFFLWMRLNVEGYRSIDVRWINTLLIPNTNRAPKPKKKVTKRDIVSLEDIMAMAKAPAITLYEKRAKATAVFLFLSGIRVTAFTTLPIKAINLEELSVQQWTELGVQTKFLKSATTFLFNIPELLEVVREWDQFVRDLLPDSALWYAQLKPDTGEIDTSKLGPNDSRDGNLRNNLKVWLDKAGLPYHSPHKFRHGHAVYGIQQAKDIADLKALSQNMMHDSLETTDKTYAFLDETDVKDRITQFGNPQQREDMDVIKELKAVRELLNTLLAK